MNTLTLNRLFKVFHKIGLSISKTDNVYHISRTNQPELQGADVLLPPGYLLDKKAIQQLMAFAEVKHPAGGEVKAAFATPDIHPGSLVPVGAVVATTQDMIIPQAIGTDIHCGMRLHGSDLTLDQFLSVKEKVVQKLKGDLLRIRPAKDALLNSWFPVIWQKLLKIFHQGGWQSGQHIF